MTELPDRLRRDLARLSARAGPPAGAQQRVLAALELSAAPPDAEPDADLDAGSGPDPGLAALEGSANAGGGAQLLWGIKIVAATLALTGAGLLGVRGAVVGVRSLRPAPVTDTLEHDERAAAPTSAVRGPALARPASNEAPAASSPPASVELERPSHFVPARTPTLSPTAPAVAPALAPAAADTLAAELELLDAARQASDPQRVLEHLQRHEQRFPAGVLTLERKLLQIEAACELGQYTRARAHYRQLPEDGASPQRARLLELCPALSRSR